MSHSHTQEHSRLMIALLDAKRGLRRVCDNGEHDERIDLLEEVLEDTPNSRSGMLPPLKEESDVDADLESLVENAEQLQRECAELDQEDPDSQRIERMQSLIEQLRDGIERL